MASLIDKLIQRQITEVKAKPDDKCILELCGSDDNKSLWFHLRPVSQINGEVVLQKLTRTLNSNEHFLGGYFKLNFIHIPTCKGGRRVKRPFESLEAWMERHIKHQKLFDPSNTNDSMCLARCIVYLQKFKTANKSRAFRIRHPDNGEIREFATKLCQDAGVKMNEPCGYDEICKFQAVLPSHRLVVFLDQNCKEFYFCGDTKDVNGDKKPFHLYIFLNNAHYYAVSSITAVLGTSYFCDTCLTCYKDTNHHKCKLSCDRCHGEEYHEKTLGLMKCFGCGLCFAGQKCFDTHRMPGSNGKSICQVKKFCAICERSYHITHKMKKHICGYRICNYCGENMPADHKCYMTPWEEKPLTKGAQQIRLYFDIETDQSFDVEGKEGWKEHKARLLVSQHVCDDCEKDTDMTKNCDSCGVRQNVFEGFEANSNVVSDFFDFLQKLCSERHREITIFCHNFRSFDGILIFQELKRRKTPPKVVLNGAKILKLTVGNLVFKDSLCFLQQRLKSLPKSFGLTDLCKGDFPFYMIEEKYFDYVGPMPSKELYSTSHLSDHDLKEFNDWYDEQVRNNYEFNFRTEILKYIVSDVSILLQAMEKFRTLFMETAHFDPLKHCTTLSSACMCNFRKNHLGNSLIGIVPWGGYRGRDKASHEALCWLDYEMHKLGKKIMTAENGREKFVLKYKVDGYVEIDLPNGRVEKRVYQYHGCYFHLCKKCIPDEASRQKIRGRSQEDPYERTKHITKKLRDHGYVVIEKWGCEFKHDLENNEEVKNYFANNPFKRMKPLNLRDAICGGRTSALYTEYVANLKLGEKLKFFDVVSEYPFCMFRMAYPVGHPTIYLEGDVDMPEIDKMNGVILATVLPPKDLFLPVLPYKCCNKLMFPLCRTCAENMSKTDCHHSDEEREIVGTWCAPELQLAVKEKYVIRKIHECYQYDSVKQYDPKTGQDGMFSSYVRQNMAMKIEASGWPSNVTTEEEKDAFIKKHFEKDGIVLDKTKFQRNPGKRYLAKLILNSFWGKLGERTLRTKTEFVKNYAELARLTEDSTIKISSVLPLDDDLLQVVYTPHEDLEDSLPTTSLVNAAFTTCHGRIVLYNYLKVVGERALYHDTDSICFISKPGYPEPKLGEYLGCLSDQLEDDHGKGSYGISFVSGGCKNYSYQVCVKGNKDTIKSIVKVRGVSINNSCSQLVTFDKLKEMVRGETESTTIHIPSMIDRKNWKIITRPGHKTWRVCLNKRKRLENNMTVPYGFSGTLFDAEDYETIDILHGLSDV
ncbi:uncharacterized protein LOC127749285 [Frankliniella occidentalis]|uniref:DNA-directed DNA polymerase n=1 Tax=Frankliniella occidentalis TaxID=133901 RepID=A0A9C6TUQ0_FRAOC|nr:uncharacterized protein LOC127749285 [Frankliniella occidentalis]